MQITFLLINQFSVHLAHCPPCPGPGGPTSAGAGPWTRRAAGRSLRGAGMHLHLHLHLLLNRHMHLSLHLDMHLKLNQSYLSLGLFVNLPLDETFNSDLVRTLGRPLDPFHDRSSSEAELVDNMEASAFPRYQVMDWTARIYMESSRYPP